MRKGELTKRMILDRSSALFNVKGYSGSSISDIMRETGLEKGGIYRHFKNKDDLAVQVFQHATSQMGVRYVEEMKKASNTLDKLKTFISVFTSLINNDPLPGGCPIMNVTLEADDSHPLMAVQAQIAMNQLLGIIEKIITYGIEQGELKPDTQAKQIAIIWISSLEGALALSRLYQDTVYIDTVSSRLLDELEKQITAK
ncbi:TetR/AcrR family transcriptional regulator [Bacillus sp. FDAARGOS_1420]|uniref:TetR/AcrR family transcriptional regulator n=1 Tax=unclassified Bacillus (in: firmicutes) TaxID=185979 RepID=UPI001C5B9078|nr:TetR/AcrR family transcriptional regulator [Bacillus sp. FDAARGOS_1420]MBW3494092.1 TetR/AcrR family transcriptional regulator [Bacillus sp. FDAARGOS_1420]